MKKLTQRGFIVPGLVIIIVVLLFIVAYLYLRVRSDNQNVVSQSTLEDEVQQYEQNTRILTATDAEALVLKSWGGCTPDTCSRVIVSTEQKNNLWYVTALYEGLRDDSLFAQKRTAVATYSNDQWFLDVPTITQSCQPNRGHQDFTSAPCI